MKKIKLKKSVLQLPSEWDELQDTDKLFAFDLLSKVIEGKLSPIEFRIRMLSRVTGYISQSDFFCFQAQYLLFLFSKPVMALWILTKLGSVRFSGYWDAWKLSNKPKIRDRSVINYNLYKLSELLDFAFKLDNRQLIFNRLFKRNPIPVILVDGMQYKGKVFNLDVAPFTDISAREFSDCFDLLSGYVNSNDTLMKEQCKDRIISILYPAYSDYNVNIVSNHVHHISKLDEATKFGILYWFTGIVDYYITHPVYSLLFRSDQKEENDHIVNLGMGGIILMLEKNGYENEETMNLNKFFDAQIIELKNNLTKAISEGVKKEDLANSIRISMNDIDRLI